MDKPHHRKKQFPEMQLRKDLSNNSSIACLQIQEGSLTPGSLPVEDLEVLLRKIKACEVCGSRGHLHWGTSAAPTPSAAGQTSTHEPALTN